MGRNVHSLTLSVHTMKLNDSLPTLSPPELVTADEELNKIFSAENLEQFSIKFPYFKTEGQTILLYMLRWISTFLISAFALNSTSLFPKSSSNIK